LHATASNTCRHFAHISGLDAPIDAKCHRANQ
jgi:hypothetical protein